MSVMTNQFDCLLSCIAKILTVRCNFDEWKKGFSELFFSLSLFVVSSFKFVWRMYVPPLKRLITLCHCFIVEILHHAEQVCDEPISLQ